MRRVRIGIWTGLTAALSTAIAILVNFATESTSNVVVWVGVGVVTILVAIVSWNHEKSDRELDRHDAVEANVRVVSSSLASGSGRREWQDLVNTLAEDRDSFARAFLRSAYSQGSGRRQFRVLDLKLINSGPGVAVIHDLAFHLKSFIPDSTPILQFSCLIEKDNVSFEVTNHGWGPARNLTFELKNRPLQQLLGVNECTFRSKVSQPGEKLLIGRICHESLDRELLERMSDPIDLEVSARYWDDRGALQVRSPKLEYPALPDNSADVYLLVKETGFKVDYMIQCSALSSTCTYGVLLPALASWTRNYSVSHVVPPNSAERFHVIVSAQQSGTYTIELTLGVNEDATVSIAPVELELSISSFNAKSIEDGAGLVRREWGFIVGPMPGGS